jgi:hypothetical protein
MGFVVDLNRMNVAITRAKKFSFLVGNSNLWRARIHEYKGQRPAYGQYRDESGIRSILCVRVTIQCCGW